MIKSINLEGLRIVGNPNTFAFVASPEIVTAMVLGGRLDFNPLTDSLRSKEGDLVQLDPPVGEELPDSGFDVEDLDNLKVNALMKINIEGGEFELLERLLETRLISRIENIQVQFHNGTGGILGETFEFFPKPGTSDFIEKGHIETAHNAGDDYHAILVELKKR